MVMQILHCASLKNEIMFFWFKILTGMRNTHLLPRLALSYPYIPLSY